MEPVRYAEAAFRNPLNVGPGWRAVIVYEETRFDYAEPFIETYCLCGGGFYKSIWEHILDKQVKVEVIHTVMHGDPVCQFMVHLPEDV